MDECNKKSKIKAYINPELMNPNFLNGSWRLAENGSAQHNICKIHINPNFKRTVVKTSNSNLTRQQSNFVHVNPNFIIQKNSLPYLENNVAAWPEDEINSNLGSCESMNRNEEIIRWKNSCSFNTTKQSINNETRISEISCESVNLLAAKAKLNPNPTAFKASLYSWHKAENNKLSNVCPKEHSFKDSLKSVNQYNLPKRSNTFVDISYKNQRKISGSKSSKERSRNNFNCIEGIKPSKCLTKVTLPFIKKESPIYASRTKLINKNLISSQSKVKSNLEEQKLLPLKKNLQLLRSKTLNASKLSATVKSAASVRTKCKCTVKLPKTRQNLRQDKKFSNASEKFKLDKKIIPAENVNRTFLCENPYKVKQSFSNSAKIGYNSWEKFQDLWAKENFNSPFYSWKSKSIHQNLLKVSKCYPNRTVVKIGGILYKSSQSKLTRTKGRRKFISTQKLQPKLGKIKLTDNKNHIVYVRGEKFILDKSGKSLRRHPNQNQISEKKPFRHIVNRVDLGGVTYLRKSNNVLIRTNTHHARYVVNHAKQKSIALLSNLRKRNNMPCMIYSRLGRCKRLSKGLCSYNHDRKNVALCKKFLRKQCNDSNCLLSHEVVQEKVATCHFFLKGCCNNENCKYLHVKVNSRAPVCKEFLQGFCKTGKNCLQRHVYACPEFDKNGKCSRGDKCLYPHKSKSKTEHKLQKTKIWIKTKIIKRVSPRNNKFKLEEEMENDGNQGLGIKKPKGSFFKTESSILLQKKEKDKYLSLRSSSNLDDKEVHNNVEFIPKRVKLDSLPCFIPLDSVHVDS